MRRPSFSRLVSVLFLLSAPGVLPVPSPGQSSVAITEVNNLTSTPIAGSGHDYLTDLSEIVSPANGSLSIRIAAPTPHERRSVLPIYAYTYDTNGQFVMTFQTRVVGQVGNGNVQGVFGPISQIPQAVNFFYGSFGAGSLSYQKVHFTYCANPLQGGACQGPPTNCTFLSNYTVIDPSGGRHTLNASHELRGQYPGTESCPSVGVYDMSAGGDQQYKIDTHCYPNPNNCFGYPTDGAVMDLRGDAFSVSGVMEDTNGNNLNTDGRTWSFPYSYVYEPGWVTPTSMTFPGLSASYTYGPYAGGNGTAQLQNNLRYNSYASTYPQSCQTMGAYYTTEGIGGASSVTLPNGQQYTFTYDPAYGYVSRITYPTGATVQYTWGTNTQSETTGYRGNYTIGIAVVNFAPVCIWTIDTPAVLKRVVSYDGVTPALEQDFAYTTTWNTNYSLWGQTTNLWTQKTTTVTTMDLIRPGHPTFKTVYTYVPMSTGIVSGASTAFAPPLMPVESTVQYYDTNGALLRTVTKAWNSPDQLAAQCTSLSNGLTTGMFYTYAPYSFGSIQGQYPPEAGKTDLVTDLAEYDYGTVGSNCQKPSSTPPRETKTTYASLGQTPFWQYAPALVDRPQTVQVYGNGTLLSETDYAYDETSLAAVSPAPYGHDETNYGPGASATWARGNVTTITKKCFVGIASCTNSVWKGAYDTTGQPVSITDANGNVTSISYADSFAGGTGTPPQPTNEYATTITRPPTNGVSHVEALQWNYNQGELAVSTDENSKSSFFYYNDPWNRPTESDYPDGGITRHVYNDSAPISATTCQLLTGSASASCSQSVPPTGWKTTVAKEDGVGHVTQTQLVSDPDGADMTDTSYDGLGQVFAKSNPHRSSASSTDGTTTYTYDALGRTTSVTDPDGSAASTTYDILGSNSVCTLVTDEAGKSRKSCADGLGRLTQVFEDPAGLNYETDYTYDALNNLLTVNQKGSAPTDSTKWRTRTFTYDSLSRLLTASNPESGTINYTYDSNGNLLTKVSPAPNQTNPAVTQTISYCYDPLNRITGKAYSAQSCPLTTPAASYFYDQTSYNGLTIANGIGRRTGMSDAAGAEAWNYDSMGRPLRDRRTTNSVTLNTDHTYNLDGSVATEVYPSGHTLTYTPGGAGRPLEAKDVASNTNYVTAATYAPQGALYQFTNGGSISAAMTYNSRLQPLQLYFTAGTISSGTLTQLQSAACPTTTATIMSRSYNFVVGTNDNGNVQSITNCRDNNRTQNFIYDSLNRIQQAYTTGSNWGETFGSTATSPGVPPTTPGIDAWGNLTNRSGVTGKSAYEALNAPATNQNRLTGFGYDAAGNMTSNGSATYTYDAENRLAAAGGVTYTYDGDGNRVKKSNGTLYWGEGPLTESDLSGNIQREFIFFDGKRVARRDFPDGSVHYMFSDHLGSADVVTTATGTIQRESDYYPFGGEIVVVNGIGNQNYKFTGKERDSESGLDNFGARYDASSLGRFMTPDWSAPSDPDPVPYADLGNPQSLNLYAYVKDNPLSATDPNGHCTNNGKNMSGWWCFWHTSDQDRQRYADQARKNLAGVKNININGQTVQDFLKSATNQQVLAAQRAIVNFLSAEAASHPCNGTLDCTAFVAVMVAVPESGGAFAEDYATAATVNESAMYASEGEARAIARTKLGSDAVEVAPGKWRSADGKWQYRAKPGDVSENHIHLERLNPQTGEVIYNLHLRWPEGAGR